MDSLEPLLLHLERLDSQLPTREIYLHEDHLKAIKEVLLTRREIKRRLNNTPQIGTEASRVGIGKVLADSGFRIDRINELYRCAVVCPTCGSSRVAVVKQETHKLRDLGYAEHRNPRVRLMASTTPDTGRFSCNGCFTTFDPPLPSHVVKLCELLFTYYY